MSMPMAVYSSFKPTELFHKILIPSGFTRYMANPSPTGSSESIQPSSSLCGVNAHLLLQPEPLARGLSHLLNTSARFPPLSF